MGYMYQYGYGVEKSLETANYYYYKTIEYESNAKVPIYIILLRTKFESFGINFYKVLLNVFV